VFQFSSAFFAADAEPRCDRSYLTEPLILGNFLISVFLAAILKALSGRPGKKNSTDLSKEVKVKFFSYRGDTPPPPTATRVTK
jgi:hypothetical protein